MSRTDELLAKLKTKRGEKVLEHEKIKEARSNIRKLDKDIADIIDEMTGVKTFPICDLVEAAQQAQQAQEMAQGVEPTLEPFIPLTRYKFERVGEFAVIYHGEEKRRISLEEAEYRFCIQNPDNSDPLLYNEVMEKGWLALISLSTKAQDELWDSLDSEETPAETKKVAKSTDLIGFERVGKRGNNFDCVFFYQGENVYEMGFDKIETRLISNDLRNENPATYKTYLELCDKTWAELKRASQKQLGCLIEGLKPRSSTRIAWKIEETKQEGDIPVVMLFKGTQRRIVPSGYVHERDLHVFIPMFRQTELEDLWRKLENHPVSTLAPLRIGKMFEDEEPEVGQRTKTIKPKQTRSKKANAIA